MCVGMHVHRGVCMWEGVWCGMLFMLLNWMYCFSFCICCYYIACRHVGMSAGVWSGMSVGV